jgi:hypothetical protein
MKKISCYLFVIFSILCGSQAMSLDITGDFLTLHPNPQTPLLLPPAHVAACCSARGDGAYCDEFAMYREDFGISANVIDCQHAGIKLTPGYFPTGCIDEGFGWCNFHVTPGPVRHHFHVYKSVIVRWLEGIASRVLFYEIQEGATGWPGTGTGVSTWGFNGTGLNFNNRGNFVMAQILLSEPEDACSPLIAPALYTGKIVLIKRGGCEFGSKILRAQNAGVRAVIVWNDVDSPLFRMGPGVDGHSVVIPAAFISRVEGEEMKNKLENKKALSLTIGNVS